MNIQEQWVDLYEWEDLYEISNLGRVRTKTKRLGNNSPVGRILKMKDNRDGYQLIRVSKDKKQFLLNAGRYMLMSFGIECPSGKHQCDHVDRDKSNNRLDNLRWVTASDNSRNRSSIKKRSGIVDILLENSLLQKPYNRKEYISAYKKGLKAGLI